MEKTDNISITIHGNVRTAEFPEESNVCVKLYIVASGDWKVITGDSLVLSSFSYRGTDKQIFVDLPFECALRGTTPYMWPRLVLNCFSKDHSGKDCVTGYGMLPLPTEPGKHACRVHCFLPEPSSIVQAMIAKLRRVNAEFVDPLLPATADGRYSCRTSTKGYVDLDINLSIKTFETAYKFSSAFGGSKSTASHNRHRILHNGSTTLEDLAGGVKTVGKQEILNAEEESDDERPHAKN